MSGPRNHLLGDFRLTDSGDRAGRICVEFSPAYGPLPQAGLEVLEPGLPLPVTGEVHARVRRAALWVCIPVNVAAIKELPLG